MSVLIFLEILLHNIYTYADVAHRRISQNLGHHRGYNEFYFEQGEQNGNNAEKQINKLIKRIKTLGDTKFFGFIHFFDTHFPYYNDKK